MPFERRISTALTCSQAAPVGLHSGELLCEFDLVGQASFSSLVLYGTALISDPSFTLTQDATFSVPFSANSVPDAKYRGRHTMVPASQSSNGLELDLGFDLPPKALEIVIYQASGGQAF
jgi:hypothetical protein